MQKKIYEVPALEVIETESEPLLVNGSVTEGTGPNETEESDPNDMNTQKKQYGFSSAPWE